MAKSPFKNIKGDPQELVAYLQKYTTDVMKDIEKEQRKIANKARKKLKETSPYRANNISTKKLKELEGSGIDVKHYRDSWTVRREYTGGVKTGVKLRILSKSKPHLSHLLENGHRVILAQGKEFGTSAKHQVSAKKHIQPVQEEANEEFLKAIDEVLRRHGK